jgi:hypothetical protein
MWAYIGVWGAACVIASGLLIARAGRVGLCTAAYWRSLLVRWKVGTFIPAAVVIAVIAPYTGDPTWDYVDAAFMSILAFATAPWVAGMLYRAVRRRASHADVFVAVCVWLFSASWSYDLYLLLRDGYYPVTWWANLVASSMLYLTAGLFWSLEWTPSRGCFFGFTEAAWPQAPPATTVSFGRVLWPALAFMLLVGLTVLAFATGWQWR